MAKARSPQYPSISLKEAVEKVGAIYAEDYQNMLPRSVVAQHMGYQSLNGKSLGVLASLGKFGLLEGRGDSTRVSDLAVQIIAHPSGTSERATALREAAGKPELFAELDDRFQGGKASDQALRSYLLTQKFIPSAADAAIRSYRETKSFVNAESMGYAAEEDNSRQDITMDLAPQPRSASAVPRPPVGASVMPLPGHDGDAFQVTASPGSGLAVSGQLRTVGEVDRLIEFLNAWKVLLKPVGEIKRPDSADKVYNAGDTVPHTGTYDVDHLQHSGASQIDLERGDAFPECAQCTHGKVKYTFRD